MRKLFWICAAVLLMYGHANAQKLEPATGVMEVAPYVGGTAVGGGSPLPVTGTLATSPLTVAPTDRGGTITLGGTAQTLMAANTSRKGCWVQNPVSATETLHISSTGNAVIPGGPPDDASLAPGQSWACGSNGTVIQTAITINAATTGHTFIAKELQ